ncbi:5-oxoprolinase subunit PxpB [Winogradskyella vincentii]|uniref:5-oxoprolinase subunit PxpB n=1 Tax=Winogradskyella vincentii TaxID=2877122 RepID=A0ABS7Y0T9_9FLAO|nr:5-oxoprolinase subunit PxpB [Winogradskyella vincentii]MCA0152850.1 5-oxoprolinase subunit PxpB [Winogradskyella vincentii]
MAFNLKYSKFNSSSILIEWPQSIDQNILSDILKFKKSINSHYIKLKVEVINTYASILIIYDFTIDNFNDEFLTLKQLYSSLNTTQNFDTKLWEIPVCYDDIFGPDLIQYSVTKEISKSKIIECHTSNLYTVYFLGFLPGFLYLGGLDPKLNLARKKSPSLNVKKGSVAIGGNQTGIYPQASPGGWHVIGNSPVELFNPKQSPPCKIMSGDKIRFYQISKTEHARIREEIDSNAFNLISTPHNA